MIKEIILTSSILSADFTRLGEQIREAEDAGVDWIHVDVMDGHFVPNLTMGPFVVEAARRATALPLDVHLMVEKPENLLKDFANAGANLIYVHVETCPHLHRTLDSIHELGCSAGVVINPGTSPAAIQPVMHMADVVLVMSVNPGFSGQKYIPESAAKINLVRRALDQVNPRAMIAVDGGITAHTLPAVVQAGAQVIIAATAIFKHPAGIAAGVQELRAAARVKSGEI
jgi:ribulose-phosphate 3-epimerase